MKVENKDIKAEITKTDVGCYTIKYRIKPKSPLRIDFLTSCDIKFRIVDNEDGLRLEIL